MNKILYANNLMFHFRSKQGMVIAYTFSMNKVSLFWMVTKDKGRTHKVMQMLDGYIGYIIIPNV